MAAGDWPTKKLSVTSLHLDPKNPRLGREVKARAPRDIIQHLFDHDKAMEVAHSIATRGFFPNEPLLAIKDGDGYTVVEGNRRLAALKALREPGPSAPTARCPATSSSWPARTATWGARLPRAASARTCSSASTSGPSTCPIRQR